MKKDYGLSISTEGKETIISFNEKAIKKAGWLSVNLCNDIPVIKLGGWTIAGHKRFKKLRRLFGRDLKHGIEISGDAIAITGDKNALDVSIG